MPPKSAPRTQEERRTETRRAILAAAIDALVGVGYARTTTTEIATRAGVSQGALFKHFATKAEIVAAAAEQLFADLIARFEAALAEKRRDETETPAVAAVRRLWEVFCEPRLRAVYLLFAEAPADSALCATLRPVVKRHEDAMLALAISLFPQIESQKELAALFDVVVFAMQGLTLQRPVYVAAEREAQMLAHVELLADQLFGAHARDSRPKTDRTTKRKR